MRIYNANANPNQWRTWTPPKSYLPKGDPESRSPTATSRSPSPRQERLGSNNVSPENSLKRYETTLSMPSPSDGTLNITRKLVDSEETQELQVSRPPPIPSHSPSTPTSRWPSVESRMQNLSLTHNPKVMDSPASSLTTFSVEDETTTTTTTTTTKRSTTARYLFPPNGFRFDISSSDTTTKDSSSSLYEQDGISSSTISTGSTLLMKNSHHKIPSPPRHENQVKAPPLQSIDSSPSNISGGREAHQSMKIPSPPSEQRRKYDDSKSPFFVLQSRPTEIKYSPPQRTTVVTSRSPMEVSSPGRKAAYENDDPPCPLPEASSPPPSPENEQCPKLAPTTTTEAESESESDESSSTSPWREFPNHGIFPGENRRDSPACVSPRLVSSNTVPFNPFVHNQHDPFFSHQSGSNINGDKARYGHDSSEIAMDSPVVMRWNHSDDKPPGLKISSGGVAIQELRGNSSRTTRNKHKNRNGGRGKIILSVKKGAAPVQDSNVKGTMLFPTKKLVPKGRLACTCSECHPSKMTKIPSPPRPRHHQASQRRSHYKKLGQKCLQPHNNNAVSSPTTSFIINKYPNLFRKYSAMFKVGFSLQGVTNAMEKDNVDPTLIDLITCASQVESTTLP